MTKATLLARIVQEWRELKSWVLRSHTVWFNTAAGLIGVFADNISNLAGVVEDQIYKILLTVVPMVNFALRMKTQKKLSKKRDEEL